MIRFTRAYVNSAGETYATLAQAQTAEIEQILYPEPAEQSNVSEAIAAAIVAHKAEILDVLTMTDASRPGARGKAKPRKAAKPAASQEAA